MLNLSKEELEIIISCLKDREKEGISLDMAMTQEFYDLLNKIEYEYMILYN